MCRRIKADGGSADADAGSVDASTDTSTDADGSM
jgi:hypothetical protein